MANTSLEQQIAESPWMIGVNGDSCYARLSPNLREYKASNMPSACAGCGHFTQVALLESGDIGHIGFFQVSGTVARCI